MDKAGVKKNTILFFLLKVQGKTKLLAPGRCLKSVSFCVTARFFDFPEFSGFSFENRKKTTPGSCSAGNFASEIYFWVFFW